MTGFPWFDGDILYANDLNATVFGGGGAGSIYLTTGSVVLTPGSAYQYSSIFVGTGCSIVGSPLKQGIPIYMYCGGNCTINGNIVMSGCGGAGATNKTITASVGGSGGAGAGALYMEVKGNFIFTGSLNFIGGDGQDAVWNGPSYNGNSYNGYDATAVMNSHFGSVHGKAGSGGILADGGGGRGTWNAGVNAEGGATGGEALQTSFLLKDYLTNKTMIPAGGGGGGAATDYDTRGAGGGGGGGGGIFWARVKGTITSGAGTYIFSGGTGGAGAQSGLAGGAGGNGICLIENIGMPWGN